MLGRQSVLGFILLSILCINASAAVLNVPSQYPTIRAALNASNNGDIINVSAGKYVEKFNITKSVTIQGNLGAMPLIIRNMTSSGTIVGIRSNGVTLKYLNITNGRGLRNTSVFAVNDYMFAPTYLANKLNASTDVSGNYKCQNSTQGAFTVRNDGSVGLNVSASFNIITSGVRMKLAHTDAGWQTACNGVCDSTCDLTSACVQITTSDSQIAYNIPQNGSKQYWLWADFNGVAGTFSPTRGNMTINATFYMK